MKKLTINSPDSLSECIGHLRTRYKEKQYLRVTILEGRDRSLSQSALFHKWCQIVATERGEQSMEDVKNEVKLTIGIPILRRDDPEFAASYDEHIKPLTYQAKLFAMGMLRVTSLMSTVQMSELLDEMKKRYESMDVDPVYLEWPEELSHD